MKDLPQGIFPPLPTPFRKDRFHAEALRANISRLNATELAGYVVLGSNGEAPHLDDDESAAVIESAAAAREEGKVLIAGTGRESTRAAADSARRAAKSGADAVLVLPPSYYRSAMTASALEFHYRSIADASEVPVLLYHVPKFAPVTFSVELVTNLAGHPNVAGMKDTSGDMRFLAGVLAERPDHFRVYAGSADFALAALALGADGGILALANIAAEQCVSLFRLARKGELDAARKLQFRLLPLNWAVTARFGVAGLKYALELLGFEGGEPRRPLEPLSQKQANELSGILEAAGLVPEQAKKK